ncbi:MAG TPA: prepilin-type N-terminal cleavage/methylation domain-containing protein [Thermoanaerobaculia bacterium]
MRSGFKHSTRGYSLVEMLVVLAIIGVLSLISVPAFMSFRRAADFKTGLGNFTNDLRNARAAAISNSFDVRVEIQTGSIGLKRYRFFSSRDNGTTWQPLQLRGTHGATPQQTGNQKEFAFSVWADQAIGLPDVGGNGEWDVIYHPNGAMTVDPATAVNGNAIIVLATDWKNITYNRYTITLAPSGQFTTLGTHV